MNEGWRATRKLSYSEQAVYLRRKRALQRKELHEMERVKQELNECVVPQALPLGVLSRDDLARLPHSLVWRT